MAYHYSPRTENPEPCSNPENCPYAKRTKHFDDELESKAYAEKENSRKYGKVSVLQKFMKKVDLIQQKEALKSLAKAEKEHRPRNRSFSFGNKEEIQVFKRIIQEEITGEGLQSPIIGENEQFRRDNWSVNDVQLLHLKNGERGYFKPVSLQGAAYYETSVTKEAMNEIAAYKFSQALGGEFEKLVPETTIRHYDGRVGTIQAEIKGTPGSRFDSPFRIDVTRKSKIYAAAFDFVIESQDRHSNNFLVVDPPPEYRLIDNGFAFSEKEYAPKNVSILTHQIGRIRRSEKEEINKVLENFIASEDGFGTNKYMTKRSFEKIIERAKIYIQMQPYEDNDENM